MQEKKPTESRLIVETRRAALARNRQRLGELLAMIRRKMTEVTEGFYDLGEALGEILEHKLYGAAGHASFGALLAAEGLMSARQASKLITVARKLPREQALTLGQERAYAIVVYAEAGAEDQSPAALVADGATIDGKPITALSVREIKEAARVERARSRDRRAIAADRARFKAEREIAAAVKAALREAGLAAQEVTVGRDTVRITVARARAERLLAQD